MPAVMNEKTMVVINTAVSVDDQYVVVVGGGVVVPSPRSSSRSVVVADGTPSRASTLERIPTRMMPIKIKNMAVCRKDDVMKAYAKPGVDPLVEENRLF